MKIKKKILVLGSGMVSRPGIKYLLDLRNLFVTVASNELEVARSFVNGYDNGEAVLLDVTDTEALAGLVEKNDIIVSLLPWTFHVKVAELCLRFNKDMATASYASEAMRKLDDSARKKGLLFLNEIGVDPGIDHMSTKKIVDEIIGEGGKVLHFYSFCGGLPAPENNNNPFGYKFSWSPKGMLLASKSSARFLENGEFVEIDGKELFLNYRVEDVAGLGAFEVYPNRDSLPYMDIYGLEDALTVMRGTYRYPGWCAAFKKIADLGLINETVVDGLRGLTYKQMMAGLIGTDDIKNVVKETAAKIGLAENSEVIEKLTWLGLFSEKKTPEHDNYLDILAHLLLEKLYYEEGEKDMLLMRHKFIVENKDKTRDIIVSTLIDFGIPGGDSSMARTVSLPLAIGVKLMSEGKIGLTGVQIPIKKEIYEPVLRELEQMNIKLEEKRIPLQL
ncbi:MAG: saccharopine dehydrogenase NADP-binding domain-containing protein [Candidatus Aminicenantes bacterium]|nr:saccharopine dehydrogenase NADP-binding domain-containing protein [Candidatus Aminicenantes bacterium]